MEPSRSFNPLTVSLSGSNLVEASAGTGKTYSIAVLVLRLLLENEIPIDKLLMVTFTNAAVAELENRIRRFVRIAERHSNGQKTEESIIKDIISGAIEEKGEERILALLKSARLSLDELHIKTIHSFCQETLREFTFETNQLFDPELITDPHPIIEAQIQQFWRTYVTGLQEDLLAFLVAYGLNLGNLQAIVSGHLNGKRYLFYELEKDHSFTLQKQEEYLSSVTAAEEKVAQIERELHRYVLNHQEELTDRCNSNSKAQRYIKDSPSDPENFIGTIAQKRGADYIQNIFADLLEKIEAKEEATLQAEELKERCINELYSFAIQEISQGVKQYKTANNIVFYDDLIEKLHEALTTTSNLYLEELLRDKYQAVFIDEFQDTDRRQYEIFEKVFGSNSSILFYIGDPKQSIYGWRKADIETYFKARKKVGPQKIHTMNINYRSTKRLTAALNHFFLPEDNFDTFHYSDEDKESIKYIKVKAGQTDPSNNLFYRGQDCIPLTIKEFSNKPEITEETARQVLALLTDPHYSIGNRKERIRPSDIGILVRSKKDGRKIKNALSAYHIPSITITEEKILVSQEAKDLIAVLEAFLDPSRSNVNRAMLTSFLPYTTSDILSLDNEKLSLQFHAYYHQWESHDIYSTLTSFLSDFNIRQNLLENRNGSGERMITNLYHLMEILYQKENWGHLSPSELVDWIKINTHKKSQEDEYEQRIESDENAVKIATIHSSKGLAYPIVFAPFLDFKSNFKNDSIVNFREAGNEGQYITAQYKQLQENQKLLLATQDEQENRRLLYVALTRAQYKCFLYKNKHFGNKSTLAHFLRPLPYNELIQKEEPLGEMEGLTYHIDKEEKPAHNLKLSSDKIEGDRWLKLSDRNWRMMSYSSLAAEMERIPRKPYLHETTAYDTFIFKDLRKGAKTGNFLHYVMEKLDFNRQESWNFVIKNALKRFYPSEGEDFQKHLFTLLRNITETPIPVNEENLLLSSLSKAHTLHEMEFNFPVTSFSPKDLVQLREAGVAISDKYFDQIKGLMNGFVDLFFKHHQQYFILDWKSNYLGPDIESYTPEAIEVAMSDNNYHLQYLIYTFAIRKYLNHRLGPSFDYEKDFGGVIYLFLRGVRKGRKTGIFYNKPTLKQMKHMESLLDHSLVSN